MDSNDYENGETIVLLTEAAASVPGNPAHSLQVAEPPAFDPRRIARRVPGSSLDWVETVRVKYGPQVRIVDLSRTGVLLESDRPLAPGSRQALEIAGPTKSIMVPLTVLRSRISALTPHGATYRTACTFNRPLELPELAAASDTAPAGTPSGERPAAPPAR